MVSKKIEQGWEKAEIQIKQENPVKALEILRTADADATESKTWRLAGEAKAMQARQSNNDKRLFKDAVGHYESALKSNPNDKKARRSLNSLRSEMDGLGIRAGGMTLLIDDGAPTFLGFVSIVVAIGLVLVGLKVIPDYLAEDPDYDATIVITLYPEAAPKTVDSFKQHANEGRYDGIVFHRIIDNFMIQGGDVENGQFSSGWSSAGTGGYSSTFYGLGNENDQTTWAIPDEFDTNYRHAPGILAMANSGPNTGGSQFYLVDKGSTPSHLDGTPGQDGGHTVFGLAVSGQWFGDNMSGIGVIDEISKVATDSSDKPTTQVPTIQKIEINGNTATMHIDLLDPSGDGISGSAMMTVPHLSMIASTSVFLAAAIATRQE
jgi:peptidyl-prolyl cis-trans isomerase B (cyclophilin B)